MNPPQPRPHLQAALLAPIVAEMDRIDVVFQRLARLGDVVVGDGVEQLIHEVGMIVEIHHQVRHAAQRPRALVEREADREDPEAVAVAGDPAGDVGEEARIERIGEGVAPQRRLGQHAAFHLADILIHAAIPDDAEDVLHPVVRQLVEKADAVAQTQKVVIQGVVEINTAIMRLELFRGLKREAARPRHVGRLLAVKDGANHFTFSHS